MSVTVTVTTKPQWLLTCSRCSYTRRYEDQRAAAIAALVHERDCPHTAPPRDLKRRNPP